MAASSKQTDEGGEQGALNKAGDQYPLRPEDAQPPAGKEAGQTPASHVAGGHGSGRAGPLTCGWWSRGAGGRWPRGAGPPFGALQMLSGGVG